MSTPPVSPGGPCQVFWGSHACRYTRGHYPGTPHECGCCTCLPGPCRDGCVARPPYYGPGTRFYGADAPATGRYSS